MLEMENGDPRQLWRWAACIALLVSFSNVTADTDDMPEPDPPPTVSHGPTLIWTEEGAGSGTTGRVQVVGIAGDPASWILSDNLRIVGDVKTPAKDSTSYSSRIAVGFRYATQELFWSDIGFKEIHRTTLSTTQEGQDGQDPEQAGASTVEKIYSGTSQQVNGLAVDWLSGSVYWTDALYNWITVAASGKYDVFRHLVLTGLDKPMGIVVHPMMGKMYWCDWGAVPKIEVARLDGEDRAVLVDTRLDRPLGMTLDYDTDTLFWVDDFLDTIDQLDLPSGDRKTWTTSSGSPVGPASFFGIAVYQNYLFVTDQQYKTVRIFNRTTQEHVHNIFLGRVPYDIIMYHESRQEPNPSDCSKLGCEHMCVSLGNGRGKCLCSYGYTLNEGNGTCTENGRLGDPMYVYSVGASICGTPINLADREFVQLSSDVHCFVRGPSPVMAMAADVNSGSIFYADGRGVSRVRLIEGATNDVISVQTGFVRGMAVDWLSSNLYYTDGVAGTVVVSRLEGRYPTILCQGLGSPRGLAVDPIAGKMYWVDLGLSVIWEADMACNNRRTLVHRVIEGRGLTLDPHEKRLYWTQKSGILSVNLNGGDKKTLIDDFGHTYADVAIYQDYFAWSDGRNGLFFGEKSSSRVLRGFRHRETNVSGDVIGYSSYSQPVSEGPCDVQNGGCSQICIPVHSSSRCHCSIGFILGDDDKTCISDLQRGRYLLFVDPYHKQVYQVNLQEDRPTPQGVGLTTPEHPSTVSMDIVREQLYWADDRAGVIKSVPLLGGLEETIMDLGTGGVVSSLAVLGKSNHVIYNWKDRRSYDSAIYMTDLKGSNKIMFENVTQSTKFTVDERNNMVYWGDVSAADKWSIFQKPINSNGQGKKRLWSGQKAGQIIKDITVSYSDNKLYWCTTNEIWRSGLGGEDATRLYNETGEEFISIAVVANHIYLSYWARRSLLRFDMTIGRVETVTEPVFARITDIKEYWRLPPKEKPITEVPEGIKTTIKVPKYPGGPSVRPRVESVKGFFDTGVPMPIVIGAAGGVLLLIAVIIGVACFLSRRTRRKQPAPTAVGTGPAHDNPTYVTTELVGDTVYEGLPGATSGDPERTPQDARQSRDSADLPDIVMGPDGIPMKPMVKDTAPPLPSPRTPGGGPGPRGPRGEQLSVDVTIEDRFIFPLDNEQLVVEDDRPDSQADSN